MQQIAQRVMLLVNNKQTSEQTISVADSLISRVNCSV